MIKHVKSESSGVISFQQSKSCNDRLFAIFLRYLLQIDFVDINMGCPIDAVCQKQAGCALMNAPNRLKKVLTAVYCVLQPKRIPLTLKLRIGYTDDKPTARELLKDVKESPVQLFTLHGRSR